MLIERTRVVVACVIHALSALLLAMGAPSAEAQDIEPRAYSNAPIGVNFLIGGYAYTRGGVAFGAQLPITNPHLDTSSAVLAYARVLDLWGMSAKFDAIVPYTWLSGTAEYKGETVSRTVNGFANAAFRLSVNFYGAPALTLKEFTGWEQDLIIGASLRVIAPVGQYDDTRLVNIGNNRWSFKPELGISKAVGPWTFELAPSVTFFTDNADFFGGNNFAQAPFYAVQGHILYSFQSGAWIALDGVYFSGGHTTLNGVKSDNEQRNTRAGFTVALPIDRQNSLKLSASTGITTRTGSEFTAVGVAWQYRWGGGY